MRTVEITRAGDRPVSEELADMHRWLGEAGIAGVRLETMRVLKARLRFRAHFPDCDDAERFVREFDCGEVEDAR